MSSWKVAAIWRREERYLARSAVLIGDELEEVVVGTSWVRVKGAEGEADEELV